MIHYKKIIQIVWYNHILLYITPFAVLLLNHLLFHYCKNRKANIKATKDLTLSLKDRFFGKLQEGSQIEIPLPFPQTF